MARRGGEYFDTFVRMAELSCRAAGSLRESLENFNPGTLRERMVALHEIEHEADEVKHDMMKKLAKEFVTPIEREDIIQLANEIDEVTDTVEDVLIRIYMYNIREIRPEALQFAEVIERCCDELLVAVTEFPNFQRSKTLHGAIVDVNTLEEEGDAIYISAMRNLYVEAGDAVNVVSWSETFDRLEECCDACEHVANVLESVVMNNN